MKSLTAAEIGEKVFMAQTMIAAEQHAAATQTGTERSEDELVVALHVGLMHWADSNGYDASALIRQAVDQFEQERI